MPRNWDDGSTNAWRYCNGETISPGLPLGLLNVKGGLTLQSSSVVGIELGGLADFDAVTVSLNTQIGGALNVSLINDFHLSLGRRFVILTTTGTAAGQFTGLPEGARVGTFDSLDLFITYKAGNGNDVALFTVPEPSAASALVAVLAMLGVTHSRRRHA